MHVAASNPIALDSASIDKDVLEKIFSSTKMLIATHCEDEATIQKNLEEQKAIYGDDIPMHLHPKIRSEESNGTFEISRINKQSPSLISSGNIFSCGTIFLITQW
jgi:hypothetical protein